MRSFYCGSFQKIRRLVGKSHPTHCNGLCKMSNQLAAFLVSTSIQAFTRQIWLGSSFYFDKMEAICNMQTSKKG